MIIRGNEIERLEAVVELLGRATTILHKRGVPYTDIADYLDGVVEVAAGLRPVKQPPAPEPRSLDAWREPRPKLRVVT